MDSKNNQNNQKSDRDRPLYSINKNHEWKDVEDCVNSYLDADLPNQPQSHRYQPKESYNNFDNCSEMEDLKEYDEAAELAKLIPESEFMTELENLSLSFATDQYEQYKPTMDDLYKSDFISIPAPDPSNNLKIYDPIQDMIDADMNRYKLSFETVLSENLKHEQKTKEMDELKKRTILNQPLFQIPMVPENFYSFVPTFSPIIEMSDSDSFCNTTARESSISTKNDQRKVVYTQNNNLKLSKTQERNSSDENDLFKSPMNLIDDMKLNLKGNCDNDQNRNEFMKKLDHENSTILSPNVSFVNTKPRKVCGTYSPYKTCLINLNTKNMTTHQKDMEIAGKSKVTKKLTSSKCTIVKKPKVQEKLVCEECGKNYQLKRYYQAHIEKCGVEQAPKTKQSKNVLAAKTTEVNNKSSSRTARKTMKF